jgi:hypothetical protein
LKELFEIKIMDISFWVIFQIRKENRKSREITGFKDLSIAKCR